MAATVVRGFVRVWPKVCEVVSQELPDATEQAELRRLAARCGSLAMQARLSSDCIVGDVLCTLVWLKAAPASGTIKV